MRNICEIFCNVTTDEDVDDRLVRNKNLLVEQIFHDHFQEIRNWQTFVIGVSRNLISLRIAGQ